MKQKIKYCNKCNKDLPITSFNKHRQNKDGLNYYCKDCINKDRTYKYHNDSIYKNKIKEYQLNGKRYKKEFGHAFSYLDWVEKKELTKGFCSICNKFIGIDKLTMDHNPPVSLIKNGHTYHLDDVDPICRSCNSSKGDRMTKKEIRGGINLTNKNFPITIYQHKKNVEFYNRFKEGSQDEIIDGFLYETERNFYDYCRICGNMIEEENKILNGLSHHICSKCNWKVEKCLDYE
jgi:5-methylcytosine-specific restriction endonuclease McrA